MRAGRGAASCRSSYSRLPVSPRSVFHLEIKDGWFGAAIRFAALFMAVAYIELLVLSAACWSVALWPVREGLMVALMALTEMRHFYASHVTGLGFPLNLLMMKSRR